MGTNRSGTKLVVGSGTGPLYLFRWILSILSLLLSLHSGISLLVSYQVGLVACARFNCMLSLEFASFLPNSWKLHGTESNFKLRICYQQIYFPGLHSWQFSGHPDGVNALIPITDNVVITGCEDGSVRAVHLYPHRFVYFLLATFLWWEIDHLMHYDLQTEIIWSLTQLWDCRFKQWFKLTW